MLIWYEIHFMLVLTHCLYLVIVCFLENQFHYFGICVEKNVDWFFSQQNELNFWKMRWRYCKTGLLSLIHQRVRSVDFGFCSCLLVEISQDFESWIRSYASMTQFPKKRTIGPKKNVQNSLEKTNYFSCNNHLFETMQNFLKIVILFSKF